jgi:hypothetical protein
MEVEASIIHTNRRVDEVFLKKWPKRHLFYRGSTVTHKVSVQSSIVHAMCMVGPVISIHQSILDPPINFSRLLHCNLIVSTAFSIYIEQRIITTVTMMRFPSSVATLAAKRIISTSNATPAAFAGAMRMFSAPPAVKVRYYMFNMMN